MVNLPGPLVMHLRTFFPLLLIAFHLSDLFSLHITLKKSIHETNQKAYTHILKHEKQAFSQHELIVMGAIVHSAQDLYKQINHSLGPWCLESFLCKILCKILCKCAQQRLIAIFIDLVGLTHAILLLHMNSESHHYRKHKET